MKTVFSAENLHWLIGSPKKSLYLYFELQANKFESTQTRVPLNISLVIDRSGSMEGDKLAYAKKAVDFVIDNLTADDFLSVVQYDDVVDVVAKAQNVKDKLSLHKLVKGITARNTTNLSGGMQGGYTQVKSNYGKGFVNRVLLLSDGLANEGVTDQEQLQKIASTRFKEGGIALSTFGVGADFNELLMTGLSEHGNGNYYFIEKPDDIPNIFARELAGLLSVVAQNTVLSLAFPTRHLRFVKGYGYMAQQVGERVEVNFNDVFSEERKAVLLRFDVLENFEQPLAFEASLSFDDVVEAFDRRNVVQNLQILPTQDAEAFRAGVQHKIVEQVALFEANELFDEAMLAVDKHDFARALEVLAQVRLYLETHFNLMPPSEELKAQYEAILAYQTQVQGWESGCEDESVDILMSQKMSRQTSYNIKKKK